MLRAVTAFGQQAKRFGRGRKKWISAALRREYAAFMQTRQSFNVFGVLRL
jgi:hypothetical protein